MTAPRAPVGKERAEAPACEDDEMPMTKSAKDALAEIAKVAVRPGLRAPANPGFRNKSWR